MHVRCECTGSAEQEGQTEANANQAQLDCELTIELALGGCTLAGLAHAAVDRAEAHSCRAHGLCVPYTIEYPHGHQLYPSQVARAALPDGANIRVTYGPGPTAFPSAEMHERPAKSTDVYSIAQSVDLDSTGARELLFPPAQSEEQSVAQSVRSAASALAEMDEAHSVLVARAGMVQHVLLWLRFRAADAQATSLMQHDSLSELNCIKRDEVHQLLHGTHTRSFGRENVDASIVAAKFGNLRQRYSRPTTSQLSEDAPPETPASEHVDADARTEIAETDTRRSSAAGSRSKGDQEPALHEMAMTAASDGLKFSDLLAVLTHCAASYFDCHPDALNSLQSTSLGARIAHFIDVDVRSTCTSQLETAVLNEANRIGAAGSSVLAGAKRLLRRAAMLCQKERYRGREATVQASELLATLERFGLYNGELSSSNSRMLSALLYAKCGSLVQTSADFKPLDLPLELEPDEMGRILASIAQKRFRSLNKRYDEWQSEHGNQHEEATTPDQPAACFKATYPSTIDSSAVEEATEQDGEHRGAVNTDASASQSMQQQQERKELQGKHAPSTETNAAIESKVENEQFVHFLGEYLDRFFQQLGLLVAQSDH